MYQCPVCGKYSVSYSCYGCGNKCAACGYAPTIVYSNRTEPNVCRPIHDHMVDTHWITEHKANYGGIMKFKDLQEKCRGCEHMKPWSLDMGGNHGCMCKKHQLEYFNKRTEECDKYEPLSEEKIDN